MKTVQEELTLIRRKKPLLEVCTAKKGWRIKHEYRYQSDIKYHKRYVLKWIQLIETRNRVITLKNKSSQPKTEISNFEYVTNLNVDNSNVQEIALSGRLRWKIENEGFNTQKCSGYKLGHKICRKSYTGLKNYYTLLQIGHAINQLIEKGKCLTEILKDRPKESLYNIWRKLIHYMTFTQPVISCVKIE
ncbi:MAG: hypothetical protein LBV17_10930 [Treponema sp.]|nr:hypothetical protein [Treponema sp.]